MSGRELDKCAWRSNYEDKTLSGIEVHASDGQIVNFITIRHKEVLKDREAHRTIVRLDDNSKPILPAKKTFEELIQAKRRQQAILYGHSTTTTTTTNTSTNDAILTSRAARRVVAAATNRTASRSRPRPAAIANPTGAEAQPELGGPLIPSEEVDQPLVARAIRPKRRRWPKLSRTRRSASSKKRNRDRALKAAREGAIDEKDDDDDENDDQDENEDKDENDVMIQDESQDEPTKEQSSPVAGTSGLNQRPTKQQSPATVKEKLTPELEIDLDESKASTKEELTKSDTESPSKDETIIMCDEASEHSTLDQATYPRSKSPSKSKNPKRKRPKPVGSRSKKKKVSNAPEGKKMVTSIKALCKQSPSFNDVDPKEVKMLLKSAEPGTSIVLPNGTVIKKSRRGGARVGAGRKRTKPNSDSPTDSTGTARSPSHSYDDKNQQDLIQIPTKQQQTPPSSPRCSSTTSSPAGRKSISRSSKKSDTSKDSIKK